jgi:hypothetical protein
VGNRAAVFGLGTMAVSAAGLLVPGDLLAEEAALGGLLIGLIFAVTGFSVARGLRRPLHAVPVLLALCALIAVAATFTAAGRVSGAQNLLVVTGGGLTFMLTGYTAVILRRALTRHGGMVLFPDDVR